MAAQFAAAVVERSPERKTSPKPEVDGKIASRFRYDPYHVSPLARIFSDFTDVAAAAAPMSSLVAAAAAGASAPRRRPLAASPKPEPASLMTAPVGTLHTSLWGRVTFVPYPTGEFALPADAIVPMQGERDLARVFIGQMPYFVTDMQLSWMVYTFGGGNAVVFPERILKTQDNGTRMPTGCIHAYTSLRAVETMAALMHKKLLVDDTGVFVATTAAEEGELATYIGTLKNNRRLRFANRPYDSVVVQLATSTFVPRKPVGLHEEPIQAPPAKHARRAAATVTPPPPMYETAVRDMPPRYDAALAAAAHAE